MINIIQQPTDFHPAYNDSFLKFHTSFNQDDRAVIFINDQYQFTVFPDADGQYLFNMAEVVKAIVNEDLFKDNIDISNGWGFSDSSLYKEISVDIVARDTAGNVLESEELYTFTKAVKQYGDKEFTNPYQLSQPTKDGMNFYLTYFEGYPMELPFRFLRSTDEITFVNQRTEEVSTVFSPQTNSPYRIFIDKGSTNWHDAGILSLPDMMSRIIIKESGTHKATVELTKKANECGKYLKWFNSDGSYSYWLFHQWYKQDFRGSEIDRISTNNFTNVYDNREGKDKITGKTGSSSIKLKTVLSHEEVSHLTSLFTSPHVQLWSEETPYQNGYWIDIKVTTNGFTYSNKRTRNHVDVNIELPNWNTQTL